MTRFLALSILLPCLAFAGESSAPIEEYDSRYPSYSMPIWKREATEYLNSNPPSQAIRRFSFGEVVYTAEKYFYFSGESARLRMDFFLKSSKFDFIEITFSDEYGENIQSFKPKISEVASNRIRYYIDVNVPDVLFETTYIFNVVVVTGDRRQSLSVPILVNRKTGEIIEISKPEKDSKNNLLIPVVSEITEPGMYRITANVFSNKVPVARLSNRVYVDSVGKIAIPLKLYGKLIIDRKIAGEANISNIVLEKIQMVPEDTGGKSEETSFIINVPQGFDNIPYSSF